MGMHGPNVHWSHFILGLDYMRILLAVRRRISAYWLYRAVTHRLKVIPALLLVFVSIVGKT